MQIDFRKRLRQASLREHANLVLREAGAAAVGAAVAALVLVAAGRATAVRVPALTSAAVVAGVAAVYVLGRWLVARPTRMQVALRIDERLALRERFSTTLALGASADPFAAAAREETYARAAQATVAKHFPVRPTRRWACAAGAWALAGAAALWMPPLDLLGREKAARLAEEQVKRLDEVKADVRQTVARVETLVKQLGDAELAKELAQLHEFQAAEAPAEIRREAIRRLGELADRLQEARQGEKGQTQDGLERMLKQLKAPSQGLSKDLSRALAKGAFADAAKLVRDLQDRLARGDLKPEDREDLAKALADLAKQLDNVAQGRKDLEDALAKAGVDPGLAKMSGDQLRRALEQAGLDPETVRKLLEKAQASRSAAGACRGLGQALGACAAGMAGGGANGTERLGDFAGQLDALEALRQQLALTEATLAELQAALSGLGQNMGLLGGAGPFSPGPAGPPGKGSGGPGQGSGPVETAEGGPAGTTPTRAPSATSKDAPIIATWESQEEQEKGEARRAVRDTVQAAKDRAAEAIGENRIPARYHEAVKQYFGHLEGRPPGGER